jgi:hypothetical protein
MAINNSVAPKGGNSTLAGALIPSYSSVALGLGYPGEVASNFPNFSGGYGSTTWRNGIDIGATANGSNNVNIVYAIYSDETSQGLSPATNVSVGWGITGNTQTDILNTINRLPAMSPEAKHTTYGDAITWLIAQNKYLPVNRNYPEISYNTATPLVAAYDPSFMASYPLTGGSIYDLTGYAGSTAGALQASTYWDSVNKNAMIFNGSSDYITFSPIPALNNAVGMTISIWFNIATFPSVNQIATLFQLISTPSASSSGPPACDSIWSRIYINNSGEVFYDGDPQQTGGVGNLTSVKLVNATAAIWNNLVVSIDGTTSSENIRFSLNGGGIQNSSYGFRSVGTFNTGGLITSYIGCSRNGGSPRAGTFFEGSIGAFHIYKDLLTDDQANDIHGKTSAIY